ncbi:hypothetical protein HAX54_039126 [Datura stramonium]|uniref:Uncharacterized protein n=1 Tax=Datura stramonium TaxID=4076 RepID=A0ABS8VPU8_DATST|nr:hypothetical protein [Datura stramonium]
MSQYYLRWKAQIEDFLQAEDYKLWNRVTNGPRYPMKKDAENNDIPKERMSTAKWTSRCLKKIPKISISSCVDSGGVIWQDFQIALQLNEFSGEWKSQDMITIFTTIVNELVSLGKRIPIEEREQGS